MFFCIFALEIMNPSTQNRLYAIDRAIRTVLKITTVVCFVLLILASFNTPWKRTIACVFFVTGAFWALLIVCRLCLSPFVKSDEEEEMEQEKRSLRLIKDEFRKLIVVGGWLIGWLYSR